jgi:hypothetical protein
VASARSVSSVISGSRRRARPTTALAASDYACAADPLRNCAGSSCLPRQPFVAESFFIARRRR